MSKRSVIKWIGDKPSDNFTMVPNDLARDRELTSAAVRVALYLWSCRDDFAIGERPIAECLGLHYNTVGAALTKLIECRWITRCEYVTNNGGRYWVYYANPARRLGAAQIKGLQENSASKTEAEPASKIEAPKKTKKTTTGAVTKTDPWVDPRGAETCPSCNGLILGDFEKHADDCPYRLDITAR